MLIAKFNKTLRQYLGINCLSKNIYYEVIKLVYPYIMDILDGMCEGSEEERLGMKGIASHVLGSWEKAVVTSDGVWHTRGHFSKNDSFIIKYYITGGLQWYSHKCICGDDDIIEGELYAGTPKSIEGVLADECHKKANLQQCNGAAEFAKRIHDLSQYHCRNIHSWEGGSCEFHNNRICSCCNCDNYLKCEGTPYNTNGPFKYELHWLTYRIECEKRAEDAASVIHSEMGRGHSNLCEAHFAVLPHFRVKDQSCATPNKLKRLLDRDGNRSSLVKGCGFESHHSRANFSACPVWTHSNNITNINHGYDDDHANCLSLFPRRKLSLSRTHFRQSNLCNHHSLFIKKTMKETA